MGHGAYVVHDATVSSFSTTSGEVELGRAWHSVYLEIPSMTSNSEIHIYGANESGGEFRRIYHPSLNSSTVGTNGFAVASAVSNGIVPIPAGTRYVKVATTATISFTAAFQIICADMGN
jgi:hypothetical protein